MAQKRMFSKKIINSDVFMNMPLSAQALYFHLNMNADDEGFVNNPRTIMRMMGAAEDDLNLLLHKKYILGWESGIVVIKHWKINNYLQNDRIKETDYIEEKATLFIKNNGAYTFNSNTGKALVYKKDTKCIQSVSNLEKADKIGLKQECIQNVSIGESSIVESRLDLDKNSIDINSNKESVKHIEYSEIEKEKLNSHFLKFENICLEKNKQLTSTQKYELIEKLRELKFEDAFKILDYSIINGYTALYFDRLEKVNYQKQREIGSTKNWNKVEERELSEEEKKEMKAIIKKMGGK